MPQGGKAGIRFDADFRYGGKISIFDLGIILNNFLDNAIETCEKLKPGKGFIGRRAGSANNKAEYPAGDYHGTWDWIGECARCGGEVFRGCKYKSERGCIPCDGNAAAGGGGRTEEMTFPYR